MNIDKAKKRSKRLPPVVKLHLPKGDVDKGLIPKNEGVVSGLRPTLSKPVVKEIKVAERVAEREPESVEEEPIEVEVTIEEPEPEPEVILEGTPKKPVKKKPKVASRNTDKLPKKEIQIIKQVLDQLDENELPLSTVVFGSGRSSKHAGYSFDDKFTAISLMKAFADDKNGVMVPNFSRMSSLLNVNTETLSSWWTQRADVISSSQGVVSEMKTVVTYELSWLLIEAISELRKRMSEKAGKMKEESLIKIIDRVVNKLSILGGDPTQRKKVDHYFHRPVQAIAPDDA